MKRYKNKESKRGVYWCNVIIEGIYKIVIAELIDKENEIFKLRSNSSFVSDVWQKDPERKGWYYKEVYESEINEFFNFNY